MRGLARQRLPARHARQVDEPLAVLLELIRHVVERVDRPSHFVARRAMGCAGLQPPRPVSTGEIAQRRGELLDRPADPVCDQHQRQQRDEPRGTEQDEQRQCKPTTQVALFNRVHEAASVSNLSGQLIHPDAAQVPAVDLDAGLTARTIHTPHVVHALPAGPRDDEALGLPALPERSDLIRPLLRVRLHVRRRASPARERVLLQGITFALVELLRGELERPGQLVELPGCRVAEAAVEERRGDPDGRAERQQG